MIEAAVQAIKEATEGYARDLPPDGDWQPMLFLFKDGGITSNLFSMPPPGPMRNFFWETVLPNKIKPEEPEAVVLLVSAWGSEAMSEEEIEKMEVGELPRPSENPNREEVLMIQGVSKEGEAVAVAKIERSDGPPELDWDYFSDSEDYGGAALSALRRGVWG